MCIVFDKLISMPPPNSEIISDAYLEFRAEFGELAVSVFAYVGETARDISVLCTSGLYARPDGNPGTLPGHIVASAVSSINLMGLKADNPSYQKYVVAKILSCGCLDGIWANHGGVPPKLHALLNPMIVAENEKKEVAEAIPSQGSGVPKRSRARRI